MALSPEKYPAPELLKGCLAVIETLGDHAVDGLVGVEIGKATGLEASTVTRYLGYLVNLGYVRESKIAGRWLPGPKFAQYAIAVLNSLSRAEAELTETRQRFSRLP